MYTPYLRARQFELIALRELLENHKLSREIIPLVEPVRLTPTLVLTIEAFIQAEHPIAVICNPAVGSFTVKNTKDKLADRFTLAMSSNFVLKALIWNTPGSEYFSELENNGLERSTLMLIVHDRDALELYAGKFASNPPKYTLIPDQGMFRRSVHSSKIILQDQFIKQKRNADYSKVDDEFFSDAHLFYAEEGYEGFADYSIIGSEFSEGGFAPYAATIHLVYFDDEYSLRIHHFVSDSVEDIQDTPGKFQEAVHKLAEWVATREIEMTMGLETLLKHYKEGTYPGLGTVKKLSIMHHLELMSSFFTRQESNA